MGHDSSAFWKSEVVLSTFIPSSSGGANESRKKPKMYHLLPNFYHDMLRG